MLMQIGACVIEGAYFINLGLVDDFVELLQSGIDELAVPSRQLVLRIVHGIRRQQEHGRHV